MVPHWSVQNERVRAARVWPALCQPRHRVVGSHCKGKEHLREKALSVNTLEKPLSLIPDTPCPAHISNLNYVAPQHAVSWLEDACCMSLLLRAGLSEPTQGFSICIIPSVAVLMYTLMSHECIDHSLCSTWSILSGRRR